MLIFGVVGFYKIDILLLWAFMYYPRDAYFLQNLSGSSIAEIVYSPFKMHELVSVRARLEKLVSVVQEVGVFWHRGAIFDPSNPLGSDDPSSGGPSFGFPLFRKEQWEPFSPKFLESSETYAKKII